MKLINNKDKEFFKNNKKIVSLPIYILFILTFKIIMGISIDTIWDRLNAWYNKVLKIR